MENIYLDNSATTAVSKTVAEYCLKIMTEDYGNPSSLHHMGFVAEQNLTKSREQISKILDVMPSEITFTSGGTESNNLAIIGAAHASKRKGNKIVSTEIEHPSLLKSLKRLEEEGFEIVLVKPEKDGRMNADRIAEQVDEKTILVSCMHVNSETGAVNDIKAISQKAKQKNANCLMHADCVQSFARLNIKPKTFGLDMMSASSHKIHGPKGAGIFYLKKGVRVVNVLCGSGQENGIRPGTENMPGWCGMGLAAQEMWQHEKENTEHYIELNRYLRSQLSNIPGIVLNSTENAAPYICNFSNMAIRSETMIHYLAEKGISVSGGSACSKGARSHVLAAMGLDDRRIDTAIRVSMSDWTTKWEIDQFVAALQEGIQQLVKAHG